MIELNQFIFLEKTLNPRSWFTRLLRLKEVYIINVKHPIVNDCLSDTIDKDH
jgi:hypothetical protein